MRLCISIATIDFLLSLLLTTPCIFVFLVCRICTNLFDFLLSSVCVRIGLLKSALVDKVFYTTATCELGRLDYL